MLEATRAKQTSWEDPRLDNTAPQPPSSVPPALREVLWQPMEFTILIPKSHFWLCMQVPRERTQLANQSVLSTQSPLTGAVCQALWCKCLTRADLKAL